MLAFFLMIAVVMLLWYWRAFRWAFGIVAIFSGLLVAYGVWQVGSRQPPPMATLSASECAALQAKAATDDDALIKLIGVHCPAP